MFRQLIICGLCLLSAVTQTDGRAITGTHNPLLGSPLTTATHLRGGSAGGNLDADPALPVHTTRHLSKTPDKIPKDPKDSDDGGVDCGDSPSRLPVVSFGAGGDPDPVDVPPADKALTQFSDAELLDAINARCCELPFLAYVSRCPPGANFAIRSAIESCKDPEGDIVCCAL